jgi:hypothetical protein
MSLLFASLLTVVVVGQASPDLGGLTMVPGDVPVVVRLRSLDGIKSDFFAMLEAMSPAVAGGAREGIDQGLMAFEGYVGPEARKSKDSLYFMLSLPDPEQPAPPTWGMVVKADDVQALIKNLAQEGEKPKKLEGYDSFNAKDGQPWYVAARDGWVAFGTDQKMIKAAGKPGAGLSGTITPELMAKLSGGDVSLYVNLAEVQKRYGKAIMQIKPAILQQLQQDGNPQGPQAAQMIDGFAEALKSGAALVLSLDFDASGFALSGLATVKAGTPAAKALAQARVGASELLSKLPNDRVVYFSLHTDSLGTDSSPEIKKAVAARLKALDDRFVMGIALTPMSMIGIADPADPSAVVKATLDAAKARQASGVEQSTIQPDALEYRGFRLGKTSIKFDMQKAMKQARPDVPNLEAFARSMIPSNSLTTYTGTDGKLFLELSARSDSDAKAQIDLLKDSANSLGNLATWKSLQEKLPGRSTVLAVVNAQELVRMIYSLENSMNQGNAKPPTDLPKTPALMGLAVVVSPSGYDFKLVIPSPVGPVFEKGLAPLAAGQ